MLILSKNPIIKDEISLQEFCVSLAWQHSSVTQFELHCANNVTYSSMLLSRNSLVWCHFCCCCFSFYRVSSNIPLSRGGRTPSVFFFYKRCQLVSLKVVCKVREECSFCLVVALWRTCVCFSFFANVMCVYLGYFVSFILFCFVLFFCCYCSSCEAWRGAGGRWWRGRWKRKG